MIWIVAAVVALLLALVGMRVAISGARRVRVGVNLARESSTLEYQLSHDPHHVIVRCKVGYRLQLSGARLALRGRLLSLVGFAIAVAAVIGSYLDITT